MIAQAYEWLYTGLMILLMLLTLCCLFRAIKGPRIADRIVSINMISTLVIGQILVLGMMKAEGYLADVALVYALLGFLAVVVLCKVFIGIYAENAAKGKKQEEKQNE